MLNRLSENNYARYLLRSPRDAASTMLAILDENLSARKICGVNEIGLFAPLSNKKITSNWHNGLLFPRRERKRRTERRAAHPTLVQISPRCLFALGTRDVAKEAR